MSITVRELDRVRDRRGVEAIDTAFETSTVFDLVTGPRSIELVELKAKTTSAGAAPKRVTILDMKSVLDSMVKSGKVSHILSLPLHAKILLLSLLSCLRRSGLAEAELAEAKTAGDARKVKDAEDAIAAQKAWLDALG